jgi:cell division protein FtsB
MTQPLVARPRPIAPNVPTRCRPSPARAAAAAAAFGEPAGSRSTGGRAAQAIHALRAAHPAHTIPARTGRDRHLRVVEAPSLTPAQRRRRARAVLIAAGAGIAAIAFALVYLHVVLAQRQFRIDSLNSQLAQEQTTYQQLRLQVAQLDAPDHIISMAEGQLGMVQPANVTYLTPSAAIPGAPPSSTSGPASAGLPTSVVGDANWPTIKSQLAGTP